MSEPIPEEGLEPAGYWRINHLHGSHKIVHIQKTDLGALTPRVDDSGGALRFYYSDGRQKIFSYAGMINAEYLPPEQAP